MWAINGVTVDESSRQREGTAAFRGNFLTTYYSADKSLCKNTLYFSFFTDRTFYDCLNYICY